MAARRIPHTGRFNAASNLPSVNFFTSIDDDTSEAMDENAAAELERQYTESNAHDHSGNSNDVEPIECNKGGMSKCFDCSLFQIYSLGVLKPRGVQLRPHVLKINRPSKKFGGL